AQVPWAEADFSGSAVGIALHADAVQAGSTRVLNVDEAIGAATVDSQGLTPRYQTEVETIVQEDLPAKKSYGRGSGLEVALARSTPVSTPDALLAGRAEAAAPPSTGLVEREIQLFDNSLVTASLLRGEAQARWEDEVCILGNDISYGSGLAADVNVSNNTLATSLNNPQRFTGSSVTRTRLVPQVDRAGNKVGDNFGLMTEVRQTYSPITLLNGTRIEILGEWVLRAVALGVEGSYIHYGPRNVSPETPVVRILDPNGNPTTNITTQGLALLGPTGLVVDIPAGSGQIAIGEDPRAIAAPGSVPNATSQPTVTPTEVTGAVDVVRAITQLAAANLQIEDIRIGHMEVKAQVPEGGIVCGLKATKVSIPEVVSVGQEFTWVITAINPFDCVARNVRVTDTIEATRGVRYTILSTDPQADTIDGNVIIWNDIGTLQPRSSRELRVVVRVEPNSAAGQFKNNVKVEANCGVADAQGRTGVGVPLRAEVTIDLPKVIRGPLPLTGGESTQFAIVAIAIAVGALPLLIASKRLRRTTGI
ncbi:MAG TPA: hypothetical protein VND22_04765, partial [Actinomycetota bacterium]|nr:hypothetical protein [Actinomycetota bacterium]